MTMLNYIVILHKVKKAELDFFYSIALVLKPLYLAESHRNRLKWEIYGDKRGPKVSVQFEKN